MIDEGLVYRELGRRFNFTPDVVSRMTLAQQLMYLREDAGAPPPGKRRVDTYEELMRLYNGRR